MSKLVETTIINLHIQILENLVNSSHWVVIMKQSHTGFHRFFLSMTILWFDKGALHVLYFWVVGSWVTWFFSSWKRRTASKAEQIHKKTTIVTQNNDLSKRSSNFVNFAQLCKQFFFFLSMRKITWLNFQQPKTRGHVE